MLIVALEPLAGCASGVPSGAPDSIDPAAAMPSVPAHAAVPSELELDDLEPDTVLAPGGALEPVGATDLCVTSGGVTRTPGAAMHVDAAGMRAVVRGGITAHMAKLSFVYRGASSETEPLANGELRQQIGLKLRAHDTCNVVYVMWQIAPTPGIYVSVKSNAHAVTHAECADRGYINLATTAPATPRVPALHVGEAHVLRAELEDTRLRVFADGAEVWEGELPPAAFAFDGPAGIRSDNARFDFRFHTPGEGRGGRCPDAD